jgi:hypothetical protein
MHRRMEALPAVLAWVLCAFAIVMPQAAFAAGIFADDFEGSLAVHWEISRASSVRTATSNDPAHGKVLVLEPDGDDVYALAKGTARWQGARLEGDVLFPSNESSYLGVVYNFQRNGARADFGVVYIKSGDSYLQANPHHDFNVGRTLYPEYRVDLAGDSAIVTARWQHFKVEVLGRACHFYVGDMSVPQMTFPLFEQAAGSIGLQPRSVGGPVWVDNVRVSPLAQLSYTGAERPAIAYAPQALLTSWDVIGPLTAIADEIGRQPESGNRAWRPFAVDERGAVVTARVTDFHGPNTVAYFRTLVRSATAGNATLHLSTIDDLALWVNGRFSWFIPRDTAAWHDFSTNEKHAGQRIPITLHAGTNVIVLRARGGSYATGGFFARLQRASD